MTETSRLRRRLDGSYRVDEWGLDPDLVQFVSPAFAIRWNVTVEGAEALPISGPALLVFNRRFGVSEPFVVARGVRHSTGRHVRITGAPDVAPLGPMLRRLGAVLARPDEVGGLLRTDHLVAVGLAPSPRRQQLAGVAPAALLAPALTTGTEVFPVAASGREIGRRWRVAIGAPIEHPTSRGPLAAEELGDRVRAGVQALLDDAFPPGLFRS
jgi:1-acyl-sn-glycerol-3-phosphate acyltransferase